MIGCMYQVCCHYRGKSSRVKVLAGGLSIGEAASLKTQYPGSFMRHVRFPFVG